MAGKIAAALSGPEAVSLPQSAEIRRQAQLLEWVPEKRADRETVGGKQTRYRLPDKPKLKAMLGGQSPDEIDSWFSTEGRLGRDTRLIRRPSIGVW